MQHSDQKVSLPAIKSHNSGKILSRPLIKSNRSFSKPNFQEGTPEKIIPIKRYISTDKIKIPRPEIETIHQSDIHNLRVVLAQNKLLPIENGNNLENNGLRQGITHHGNLPRVLHHKNIDVKSETQFISKGICTLFLKPDENHFQRRSIEVIFCTQFLPHLTISLSPKGVKILRDSILSAKSHSLDSNKIYWISINSIEDKLFFGYHEPRPNLVLHEETISDLTGNPDFSKNISYFTIKGSYENFSYTNETIQEMPLIIKDHDKITLNDLASGKTSTITSFPSEIQELYGNIGGKNVQIDTTDFPDFSNAIQWSITHEEGWCYKKIREKADGNDIKRVYLRITLGKSIGGSPGNPYVFEIWPVGHYSSIHRHSNSFVVIKVLKGTINVKLFPELDIENTTPFQQINLREGDVTWGSPNYNQTHQVLNSAGQSVAITLQSYKYSHNDLIHYEFFDYIDRDRKTIEHFQPKSDCDFLEFKEIIKKEWGQFQSINL